MSNNENQLSIYKDAVFGDLTPKKVKTIRDTIAKDCNEEQFSLFMAVAQSSGANPLHQEIFPTVRSGQLTIQFGVEFYIRKAKETDGFQGYDVQLVHENDEFKMHQERAEDGRYYMVIDQHSVGFPRGKVIGGYVFAYKEGLPPFTVLMEVDEVEHLKKSNIGMQKTMWNNYFNDMFKKHMVRRALKAAFGLQFGDDEPIHSEASETGSYDRTRKDITPDVAPEPDEPKQVVQAERTEEDKMIELKQQMKEKFKTLGITTKKAMADYIDTHLPNAGDNPSISELIALLEIMDMDIERRQFEEMQDLPE